MKKSFFKLIIAFTALIIGLASVWLLEFNKQQDKNSPTEAKLNENLFVERKITSPTNLAKKERFTMTSPFGGLNGSYGAIYDSSEGQKLSTGVNCWETKSETLWAFARELSVAKQRIKNSQITNKNNKKAKRIVIRIGEKETQSFEILEYDETKCYSIITAPTLELALEFEKWQKSQKQ